MSSFWLEYVQDGQRREFSFDTPSVSIGRDKASDFVLDHPTVSRQHALIVLNNQGPQLVVLSRGGLTAIDGNQVSGEIPLYDGSEIHFGQLSFTFRSHSAPRKPSSSGPNGWAAQGGQGAYGSQQYSQPYGSQQYSSQSPSGTEWPQASGWEQPSHSAASSGSFGSMANPGPSSAGASGGWGNTGWDDAGGGDDDLVSWDQIAQSAEEEPEQGYGKRGATDFERMQIAQQKAEAGSQGNSPVRLMIAGLLIAGLLAFIFIEPGKKTLADDGGDATNEEEPFILYAKGDIDCVGRANCEAQAISAYKVGKKTYEAKAADIINLYESYRQLDRAEKLLEAGGVTPLPAEMADLPETKKVIFGEMEAIFQQYRVTYNDKKKRKMYQDMADILNKITAYFPDKRCRYNRWAFEREREMKQEGVFPKSPYF